MAVGLPQQMLLAEAKVAPYSSAAMGLHTSNSNLQTGAASTVGAGITTSTTNVILVAVVFAMDLTNNITVNTVTDSQGRTWMRRTFLSTTLSSSHTRMEIWWAVGRAAATYTVTATLSASAAQSGIHVFAVTGVFNEQNPWDSAVALSATATFNNGSSTSTGSSSTFTPIDPKTFIFSVMGTLDNGTAPTINHVDSLTTTVIQNNRVANTAALISEFGVAASSPGAMTCSFGGAQHFLVLVADALAG